MNEDTKIKVKPIKINNFQQQKVLDCTFTANLLIVFVRTKMRQISNKMQNVFHPNLLDYFPALTEVEKVWPWVMTCEDLREEEF